MNKKKVENAVARFDGLRSNVPNQIKYTQWFRVFEDVLKQLKEGLEPKKKGKGKGEETPKVEDPKEPEELTELKDLEEPEKEVEPEQ